MSDEQDIDRIVCPQCQSPVDESDILCLICGMNLTAGENLEQSPSGIGSLVAFVIVVALIMLVAKVLGAF